jgi:hypothetical protein
MGVDRSPGRSRASGLQIIGPRTTRMCSPLGLPASRLFLLEGPVHQSSFQQPKKNTDDRVDEELIEVDKKSRG